MSAAAPPKYRFRKDKIRAKEAAMRPPVETPAPNLEGAGSVPLLPPGTVDATLSYLFPQPDPYETDPEGWVRDRLQEHFWSKQVEIAQSVVAHRYTAVKACHGPGKSYAAARLACWWLMTHELGSAFVVTTAPSWPQVQAILWREIRRCHRRAQLPGRITQNCMWHMGEGRSDEELIAMGRKPADYDEQAFQGIHAEYILVIMDEACGIPTQLWNAVDTLMTNENARCLAIGNPDDPGADFARKFDPKSEWNKITIAAHETPAWTGERVPENVMKMLVTKQWVGERIKEWGADSPLVASKVHAQFPDISDNYLITPSMLRKGYNTELPGFDTGRYGCDVARQGEDKSELYRNRGGVIRHVKSWAKKNTMETTGEVAQELNKHGLKRVPAVIDVIGLGAGVYDRLYEQGYEVGGFNAALRALDPVKFINRRAEVYWHFRLGLENGDFDLDELDEDLAAQLQSIQWWINSTGKIQLESKEDMKKRGAKSPDRADAAVMSTIFVGLLEGPLGEVGDTSIAGDLLEIEM